MLKSRLKRLLQRYSAIYNLKTTRAPQKGALVYYVTFFSVLIYCFFLFDKYTYKHT